MKKAFWWASASAGARTWPLNDKRSKAASVKAENRAVARNLRRQMAVYEFKRRQSRRLDSLRK